MRREQVVQELAVLQCLQHPHLVSLLDTYETPASYVLILDMCVNLPKLNLFVADNSCIQ